MTEQQPTINPNYYLHLYLTGSYEQLSDELIKVLTHFELVLYSEATPELQYFVDVFIKNFLYLFTQPDYLISDRHALRFIQLNPVVANLTAISHQKTTDFYLRILQQQPQNFIKILTLFNPYCQMTIDYKQFFNTNATLASRWYSYYVELYLSAQVNPLARQNLRHHLDYTDDERLTGFANIADVCFGATYINHNGDRPIKYRLNQAIQNSILCQSATITNHPRPHKIAVITAFWHSRHSVYRTLYHYIEAIAQDYELTLIYLGKNLDQIEQSGFQQIIHLTSESGTVDFTPILHNEFMVAYFPDVGMSPESILLANLRLAPIQITGTGHPVSTYGANIDYFISGATVEAIKNYAQNYDERLVLLPDKGAIHSIPEYSKTDRKKSRSEIMINCPWLAQKINEPLIRLLLEICNKASKPIFFRFFVGSSLRKNGHIPFVRDLAQILGSDNFEVITTKPYDEYMMLMEEGDLCLDAYPFGGSNVIADCLFLRKPTVTYQGKKWANRVGSQLLKEVGLAELIATNDQEYINHTVKLIDNTAYRQGVGDRLKKVDLNATIFNADSKHYFKKAIDFLIANHHELQRNPDKTPIRVPN